MRLARVFVMVVVVLIVGFVAGATLASAVASTMSKASPSAGYTLHIDADQHFGPAHAKERAHHWCKNISKDLIECQLYESDAANARLVGVETVVPSDVYKTFSASEQSMWHYHRTEIPKVNAAMPDLSKAEADKVTASLLETYGKIYILWDPKTTANPVGQPSVTVLK